MSNKSMIEQNDSQIESARLSLASIEAIVQTVRDAMQSQESKRAYERALRDFMAWYTEQGEPALNKATVQRYLASLREQGLSAANINQRRAAINKLVSEAADNLAIPDNVANGILRIKGERQEGQRLGNWLNKEQAQALLNSPDINTLKGLRDRAILAVALGAGLRRSEIAKLDFDDIQLREARWLLVDIVGKRQKTRSVPLPSWAKQAIDEYAQAAGISDGRVFRRINKGDNLAGQNMSAQAIYDVIVLYSQILFGDEGAIAAHDTRRTYAHLALKGGSPIEQISLTLGHSNTAVTQRYLGVELDLHDAPGDRLGLSLDSL